MSAITTTPCTINDDHCEQCGRPARGGSYSDCCNELVVVAWECRAHHNQIIDWAALEAEQASYPCNLCRRPGAACTCR